MRQCRCQPAATNPSPMARSSATLALVATLSGQRRPVRLDRRLPSQHRQHDYPPSALMLSCSRAATTFLGGGGQRSRADGHESVGPLNWDGEADRYYPRCTRSVDPTLRQGIVTPKFHQPGTTSGGPLGSAHLLVEPDTGPSRPERGGASMSRRFMRSSLTALRRTCPSPRRRLRSAAGPRTLPLSCGVAPRTTRFLRRRARWPSVLSDTWIVTVGAGGSADGISWSQTMITPVFQARRWNLIGCDSGGTVGRVRSTSAARLK